MIGRHVKGLLPWTSVCFLFFSACQEKGSQDDSSAKGYFISETQGKRDFRAYSDGPTVNELRLYIEQAYNLYAGKTKPTRTAALAKFYLDINEEQHPLGDEIREQAVAELAQNILKTATCFQLDPFFFVGLIQTESIHFDPQAISPTGARGLTQMTRIAIKEANHQLGQGGTANATQFAIDYYTDIMTNCLKVNWHPIWDQESNSMAQLKLMGENFSLALAYGAIILHEGLALTIRGKPTTGPEALYRTAFNRYNGSDPAQIKAHEKSSVKYAHSFADFVNQQRESTLTYESVTMLAVTGYDLQIKAHWDPTAIIHFNDFNELVKEAQILLRFRSIAAPNDGVYNRKTAKLICQFLEETWSDEEEFCESGWNISVATWNKLQTFTTEDLLRIDPLAEQYLSGGYDLAYGDGLPKSPEKGPGVKFVQKLIITRGYWLNSDGQFGPTTRRKLMEAISDIDASTEVKVHEAFDGSFVNDDIWNLLVKDKQIPLP